MPCATLARRLLWDSPTSDRSLSVEVADRTREKPSLREPGDDQGRGLHILAAIAAEWGVREEAEGKVVFFRLRC